MPRAAGNSGPFLAESFIASISSVEGKFTKRRFQNGVWFRTLCSSCNNNLGGTEDQEITNFYRSVRRLVGSSLTQWPRIMHYEVRPNILLKGILVHLLSANESGTPSEFDELVRAIYRGETNLHATPLNVFYWPYRGKELTIVREVVAHANVRNSEPHLIYLIKLKPLSFAVTTSLKFGSRPRLNDYITNHDSLKRTIPLIMTQIESNSCWPATVGKQGLILTGAGTSGLVATPTWRTKTRSIKRL